MKLFLFELLDQVSDRWHASGAAVVIAVDEEGARALTAAHNDEHWAEVHRRQPLVKRPEGDYPLALEWPATAVYEVGDSEAKLYVFPDAGCC